MGIDASPTSGSDPNTRAIRVTNRAGLDAFVKGSDGSRSPTFREDKRYPLVVVLPLLQRVFRN